eukprot:TRINITY_DN9796_c0_g1_i11.p2 TRINITY_DN9796_c0_g1~~TRINITY_DN9796_c0_g1_i11.p2  ORF type:complete len:167 (-),score=35.03 TRINITY_DN9796_c0_g1_i11:285-785(-)
MSEGMNRLLGMENSPLRSPTKPKAKALLSSPGTNLDGKGESRWVYPEEDGKYALPRHFPEAPTAATGESADGYEFENILNIERAHRYPESAVPQRPQCKNEGRVYTSNIASIVNSAFSVYGREGMNTIYKTSDKPKARFPRDVFKVSCKTKHMVPCLLCANNSCTA